MISRARQHTTLQLQQEQYSYSEQSPRMYVLETKTGDARLCTWLNYGYTANMVENYTPPFTREQLEKFMLL